MFTNNSEESPVEAVIVAGIEENIIRISQA